MFGRGRFEVVFDFADAVANSGDGGQQQDGGDRNPELLDKGEALDAEGAGILDDSGFLEGIQDSSESSQRRRRASNTTAATITAPVMTCFIASFVPR